MWKTSVPAVFLWRLAQQSLPTADLLQHGNISVTPNCTLCGAHDSWRHTSLECSMARCVWALASDQMTDHMSATTEPSAKQWLFAMMDSLSHADFTNMVVTLWAIYTAWRKAIHEDEFQSPLSTHLFIQRFLSDLQGVPKPHLPAPVHRAQ